jgi:DNA invertase Pin-like site-specific DNA recombinase
MNGPLERAARDLYTARQTLDACMWRAKKAAIKAAAKGTPETEIAGKLGVNRMTVRKWLGKL